MEQLRLGRPVGLGKAVRRRPLLREEQRRKTQGGRECPCSTPFPWLPSPQVRLSPQLATEKKGHCSLIPFSSPSERPLLPVCEKKSRAGGGDKVAPRLTLNPDHGKGAAQHLQPQSGP